MTLTLNGLRLGAYVLLTAASLATGWKVRDWQADTAELVRLQQQEQQRALVADVTRQTLGVIAKIRIEHKTIYQQAVKEVIRDPIYTDCRVPAAGVRLLNDARNGQGGRGPAAGMPAARVDTGSR